MTFLVVHSRDLSIHRTELTLGQAARLFRMDATDLEALAEAGDVERAGTRLRPIHPPEKQLVPVELVRQPPGSSLCGQACVAMIAGIHILEAARLVGTNGATGWPQLGKAFDSLGVKVGPVQLGAPGNAVRRAVVRVKFPNQKDTHFVVYAKSSVRDRWADWFDPASGHYPADAKLEHPPRCSVVSHGAILVD